MTLAEFFQEIRHGKAGRWLSPDDEDALRSPDQLTAALEGTHRNTNAGSALAVFVPVGDLASQGS
jgi:uncharacterized protein YdeI (YjbR/CyaY-like superfamily)